MPRFNDHKLKCCLWGAIKTHFTEEKMWEERLSFLSEYDKQKICAQIIEQNLVKLSLGVQRKDLNQYDYSFDQIKARTIGNIITDTLLAYKRSGEIVLAEAENALREKIKSMLPEAFSSDVLHEELKKTQKEKQEQFENCYRLYYAPRYQRERALGSLSEILDKYESSVSCDFCGFSRSETAEDKACVSRLVKEINSRNSMPHLKQIINDYMATQKDPKNKLANLLKAEGFVSPVSVEMQEISQAVGGPNLLVQPLLRDPRGDVVSLRANLSL